MMQHYAQLIVLHYQTLSSDLDDTGKISLARWIEWVNITLDSAISEHSRDYQRVKRRTVIVVADVLEAVVEVILATCLEHIDPSVSSVRKLTGYKRQIGRKFDSKMAVRFWERSLFASFPSRSERFSHMVKCFFPKFSLPQNAALIDDLVDRRNELTHDIIPISRIVEEDLQDSTFSHEQIDQFFESAGDFALAILTAIPGDLQNGMPALDPRYASSNEV